MINIEILYIDGCPNLPPVRQVVEHAVHRLNIDAIIRERSIADDREARDEQFRGSPSVRVDGQDIENDDGYRGPYALSCRTYAGQSLPPDDLIDSALERAIGIRSTVNVRAPLLATARSAAPLTGVAGALWASACCWVPLATAAVGASAGSLGLRFDTLRPYALTLGGAAAGIALLSAFRPAPDSIPCGCGPPARRRTDQIVAILIAAAVLVSAAFPDLLALRADKTPANLTFETAPSDPLEFSVTGMTCPGCASTLESTLARLPDVQRVSVDFTGGRAYVWTSDSAQPDHASPILSAIETHGFTAHQMH